MYRSLKHVASLLLLMLLHVDAFSQTAPAKPPAKTGYFMLLVNRIKAQAKAYQLMSSRRDGPRQGGDVIAIYNRETKTERIVFECRGCRNPLLYQGTYFYVKDSTSIGTYDPATSKKTSIPFPDTLKSIRLIDISPSYIYFMYEASRCKKNESRLSVIDRATGRVDAKITYDSCYHATAPAPAILNGIYLANTQNMEPFVLLESENLNDPESGATFAHKLVIQPSSYSRFDPVWINEKEILYAVRKR